MNYHVYNICMLAGLLLTGIGIGLAFGAGAGLAASGLLLIGLTLNAARIAGRKTEG